MTLSRSEVGDLVKVARSITGVINDERYSGVGRATIIAERARCLVQGLECIHAATPPDADAPGVGTIGPTLTTAELERAAFGLEPSQCSKLLRIAHLPQFVLALLQCSGVPPESHADVICAWVKAMIADYHRGQLQ